MLKPALGLWIVMMPLMILAGSASAQDFPAERTIVRSSKQGQTFPSKDGILLPCCLDKSFTSKGRGWLIQGVGCKYGNAKELTYLDDDCGASSDYVRKWHEHVASTINKALEATTERTAAGDKLLVCDISYEVTTGGRITNATIESPCVYEKSTDHSNCPYTSFNAAVLNVLQNLTITEPPITSGFNNRMRGRVIQNYGIVGGSVAQLTREDLRRFFPQIYFERLANELRDAHEFTLAEDAYKACLEMSAKESEHPCPDVLREYAKLLHMKNQEKEARNLEIQADVLTKKADRVSHQGPGSEYF